MRLNERSSVLLPQPDGPMSAVIWFFGTCRLISRTARNDAVVARQLLELEDDLVRLELQRRSPLSLRFGHAAASSFTSRARG